MSLHLAANDEICDTPASDEILRALPFAAYISDAAGRITAFNEAAMEIWGRAPEPGEMWVGDFRLNRLDGTPLAYADSPMAKTLRSGKPARDEAAVLERAYGSPLYFSIHSTALKNAKGEITGGMHVLQDASERHADRTKAQYWAIVESSEDAIISKTLDGIIQTWNKGAERVFGYPAEEAVGRHVSLLIPEDRLDEEPGIIERIKRGERVEHFDTVRQRKDGSLVDLSLTISPMKNALGQIIGASKIARDITDKKRAEQGKELLLHEIKHRVKITLGTVLAIAAQTFRLGPKSERDSFAGRLRALSEAHDLLTQQSWDQVSMLDMIQRSLAPFRENRRERFTVSGNDAILSANQALLLAMTMHELATNAVKYGALSNADGTVNLSWRIAPSPEGGRSLKLEWREEGGPPVSPSGHKGFGSTLIERAVQQERGRSCFEFRVQGVVCTLEMKI